MAQLEKQRSTNNTILAVGAAGNAAGHVVPALARRGARVRGLVQRPEQADQVRRRGAAEVAIGDLNDEASRLAAMRGVRAMFYIDPAFASHEADTGVQVADLAARSGVRRFVFSSLIHPVLSRLVNHAAKAPVEEAVLNSGMEFVFLHPALFFQNHLRAWAHILESGIVSEAWSEETRFTRRAARPVLSDGERGCRPISLY